MDEKQRKQITDANDNYVGEWFEASGFASKKLDTGGGKRGKRADWMFTKSDLTVFCEVKTIFSGGQSTLSEDQYERRRLESKYKFARFRSQAIADGTSLITHKDEQDYLEGKISYQKQNVVREEEFNNFLSDISNQLEADETINHLPFSMTISISMYVVYRDQRKEFIEWLKRYVLWANLNHTSEQIHTSSHFTFTPNHRAENGKLERGIEAFVQMWGPTNLSQLHVGFIRGGVPHNEIRISEEIDEAVSQLKASMGEATTSTIVPIIALWSASDYLHFQSLLMMDETEKQLGNVPQRYYLVDWAFEAYCDLAAIVLCWFHYDGDVWNPSPSDKSFPVGLIITNPKLPDAEKALKAAYIENSHFITGMDSDPLNE